MRKFIILSMTSLLSVAVLAENADINDKAGRLYITGDAGAGVPSNLRSGMALNASIGYYVFSHLHVEVGGGYNHFGINPFQVYAPSQKTELQVTGTENIWSIHTNALYDIPLSDSFTFTLGAGLGWALNSPNANASDGVIAYKYNMPESNHGMAQGMAALNYMLGEDYAVGLNYNFMYLPTNDPVKYINQFSIGITSYF